MKNKGFTLIEIMIVVVVVGVMAGVGVPSFQKSINDAREQEARTVLTSIYEAERSYYLRHKEYIDAPNEQQIENRLYVKIPESTRTYYSYSVQTPSGSEFLARAQKKGSFRSNCYNINASGDISDCPQPSGTVTRPVSRGGLFSFFSP